MTKRLDNMTKIFTLFMMISLFLLNSCKSSNYIKYHNIVNEAEYAFYNEDYITASKLYGKAFKKVKTPFEHDMFFYSASLWEIGEQKKSLMLLDTIGPLDAYLNKTGFFENMDPTIKSNLLASNKLKVDKIDSIRLSNPLIPILDSLTDKDHFYRRQKILILQNSPVDSLLLQLINRQIKIQDSLNLIVIDSLIKVHGFIGGLNFPTYPQVMRVFMLHNTEWVLNNPKLFYDAINTGRLWPGDYACAYDKAVMNYKTYASKEEFERYKFPQDTLERYGQFNSDTCNVSPETVFYESTKIGVSPYFQDNVPFTKKKGKTPEKHLYYEYYKKRKKDFRCY